MASDQELLIRINGTAKQFTDELDKVKKRTEDLQKGLRSVAKNSALAFTALAGAIGTTVLRFSEFEKTFTNVQTLLDKSSFSTKTLAEGVEGLKRGVIALGAESGESFDTLNKGLFDLISGGVSAEKGIETLRVATELATAGATDTATAVKALTATMTSFGESAGDASDIAEKFFTAQKFGVTTVGELATEFNKVGGIAQNLGLTFDETLASLSSLTANGAKPTAQAATELKATFNSVILAQQKLGKESFAVRDALDLQNIKQRGLIKSLELFKEATGGSTAEIQRILGSAEALSAVLSLTGAQADLVATQISEIGDASKRSATFQDALAVKQATTEKAFARLKVAVDAVLVTLGESFAPTINAVANALSAGAKQVATLDKSTIAIIATILKFVTGITALVAVVSTLTLGYIKLKAVLITVNSTLDLGAKAIKLYNATMLFGQKAAQLFATGLKLATTTVRGFLGATGIGLLLVVLGYAIADFKTFKAVVQGSLAAAGSVIKNFAKNTQNIFGSIGNLLISIFTFDKGRITAALDGLKTSLIDGFSTIGSEAGAAYTSAFNASIAESEAGEAKKPQAASETIDQDKLDKAKGQAEAETEVITEAELARRAILEEIKAEEEAADRERKKNAIKRELKYIEDKKKFGESYAAFNKFLASDEVQTTKETTGQLLRLQNSKNTQVKQIGKAAAITQAGIKTAEGAISAYSSLAGIPLIGPALGAAAAAAVIAYGAEQVSAINSAQRGGLVPNATGGSRDRVPMLLEPNELVVPAPLVPDFIQAVGRPDTTEGGGGQDVSVTVGFSEDAFEIIEQKLVERRSVGIGVL